MIYLQKGLQNTLTLNINNNSRLDFTGYTLTFIHVMSKEVKSYLIDTSDPNEYGSNIRYCEIVLNLQSAGQDLNYEGQYVLNIYGQGEGYVDYPVFTGMAVLEGTEEEPFFTEYISSNEDNQNYIYVSD